MDIDASIDRPYFSGFLFASFNILVSEEITLLLVNLSFYNISF